MSDRQLVRRCRQQLRSMDIVTPLDVDKLGARLGEHLGRRVRIEPHPLDPGVSGLWLSFTDLELILFQEATTATHQRAIVFHELAHVIAGHGLEDAETEAGPFDHLVPHLSPSLIRSVLGRTCYDDQREYEAEMMATVMLDWADRMERSTPSRSTGRHRWLDGALNESVGWA